MDSFESVSTWKQPTPQPVSAARTALVVDLANRICSLGPHRLRVAIDGLTAAGKTSFGHEVAAAIRALGRPTLRASLDDFKRPWREAAEQGYDRVSGEGYYRNAPDLEGARRLLLEPAGPQGSGQVVLCAHDPLTGHDHRDVVVSAPPDAVLVVDGVFAFRPEYDAHWEYRVWLQVEPAVSLRRGVERDTESEGGAEAALQLHRHRYHVAEAIYLAEVDPQLKADVVIDNTHFADPMVLNPPLP